MNGRKILHDIVDALPDSELITAARILTALKQPADPLKVLLENAPLDDEPGRRLRWRPHGGAVGEDNPAQ